MSNPTGTLRRLTGELGSPVILALSLIICTAGGSFTLPRFIGLGPVCESLWFTLQKVLVRESEVWFVQAREWFDEQDLGYKKGWE